LLGAALAMAGGGCGGGEDTSTSTDGISLFPTPGATGGGTGGAPISPTGGLATGPIVPNTPAAMTPAGAVTMVGPSLCSTQSIDAYGTAPDMMIVLDRSLSMTLNNRWDPSKEAIRTITSEFDRLVSFGLTMFPGSGATDPNALIGGLLDGLLGGSPSMLGCAGGEKVDVPMKVMNSMAITQAVNSTQTMGLTPTGAGLGVALQALGDRKSQLDAVVKPGYVLLMTDGEPSCDPTVSPDQAQVDAALMAVRALKAANIPTYVIGYQIAAQFQPLMNQLAMEGGTGMYHPTENADQIIQTFREITKDVVKCSFELSMVPPNPKFVRVTIDKKTVLLDSADGWVINGKTVTLQGGACATLKDGKGHALNAQIECNEVTLD
jgi:Mg-chelatase subunit ChlD